MTTTIASAPHNADAAKTVDGGAAFSAEMAGGGEAAVAAGRAPAAAGEG